MANALRTYRVEAGNSHSSNQAVRFLVPSHLPAISGPRLSEVLAALHGIHCKHALSPLTLSAASLAKKQMPTAVALAAIAMALQRHVGCDVKKHGPAGTNQRGQNMWWIECWDHLLAEKSLDYAGMVLEQKSAVAEFAPEMLLRAGDDLLNIFLKDGATASNWIVSCAARELRIPQQKTAPRYVFLSLGIGKRCMRFRYSVSEDESFLNNVIQHNKALTSLILSSAGISVPDQEVVGTYEQAVDAAERIGFPVVVKPVQGQSQQGVEVNIRTAEMLRNAIDRQNLPGQDFIVEKYFDAGNYRFMAAKGNISNCFKRLIADVEGDGTSTIRQLIEALNRDPRRGPRNRYNRSPIDIDALDRDPRSPFRDRGLTLAHIPARGERIPLSYFWLGAHGGEIKDITPEFHPSFQDMVRRLYAFIPIPICGIDILVKDIMAPATPENYVINEINSRPALSIFHRNRPGDSTAARFLAAAIGESKHFLVPVGLIVSDQAEPEIADLLRRHLTKGRVAHAGHAGYRIGNSRLSAESHASIAGTKRAMADREADALLLERTRQELELNGLGLTSLDVIVLRSATASVGSKNSSPIFAERMAKRAAIYLDTVPEARAGAGPWPHRAVVWTDGSPPEIAPAEADRLVSLDPQSPGEILVKTIADGTLRRLSPPENHHGSAALVAAVLQTLPMQST